jgi:hypothetical protein
MDLIHAGVGERIEVYVTPRSGGGVRIAYSSSYIGQFDTSTLWATVIQQIQGALGHATVLAWKVGENHPLDPTNIFTTDIPDIWKQQGFVVAHKYGSHCQYKPSQQTIDYSVLMAEAPCKQCGEQNDLGAKKCWWCETLTPTVSI